MVSVGPTPPSAGTLGSSRSMHAGSARQAAAMSSGLQRTVITDKGDPPPARRRTRVPDHLRMRGNASVRGVVRPTPGVRLIAVSGRSGGGAAVVRPTRRRRDEAVEGLGAERVAREGVTDGEVGR